MRVSWMILGLMGCFTPLDLPPPEPVPIVAKPFTPCRAEDDEARVACVIDGDTLDVGACGEAGERIRLLGIDAPETSEPAECFAPEAAQFLAELLEGETVTLSFDETCTGTFGRTLAYVWLRGDTLERALQNRDLEPYLWSWFLDPTEPALLLNEALLGLGYVEEFPEEIGGTLAFQSRLDIARNDAEVAGRGLWGSCGGTP